MNLFSFYTVIATMLPFFGTTCAFQSSKSVSSGAVKPETPSFDFYGDIAPLGFFDPLGVTTNCDEKTLQYMREAEIHHGRIAMTAAVMLPVLDKLHPDQLAIDVLSKSGGDLNDAALASMGLFEVARMTSLYKPPRKRLFELKDDAQPGKLNPYTTLDITKATKELSNGRLAMIRVFLYMLQEFVSQQKIIS